MAVITRFSVFMALAFAATPSTAKAEIRAVFVGIDKYLYSKTRIPEAQFRDLSGAVRDTKTIKGALKQAYGLNLDHAADYECQSANDVSITLTDSCATKAAIFEAWDRQIAASKAGDTLILYFAGHGSRFIEDQNFDQASLYSSTILPTDARKPGAESVTDILDSEIRHKIDGAIANGIRVVSIFDSCSSGTATRDGEGENRSAPALTVKRLRPAKPLSGSRKSAAYRVHLAASADDEEAKEVGGVGKRAGVFTSALSQAIVELPYASFADIAAKVQVKVTAGGNVRQNPQAEGALRATLGGGEVRVPLFKAFWDGSRITLAGGELTGITIGSTFALFPTTTAALTRDFKPLSTGRITQLEASLANLTLGSLTELPRQMIARETLHEFGPDIFRVTDVSKNDQVASVLATLPFVEMTPENGLIISERGGVVLLADERNRLIASLDPSRNNFRDTLKRALEKVARVKSLLALRSDPSGGTVEFCVQNPSVEFDVGRCPSEERLGRQLKLHQSAIISAKNTNDTPRYIYVLGIDQEYSITLLLPPNQAIDPAVEAHQPLRVPAGQEITPSDPGFYFFVTFATDARIDLSVLEQSGAAALDAEYGDFPDGPKLTAREGPLPAYVMRKVNKWAVTINSATVK